MGCCDGNAEPQRIIVNPVRPVNAPKPQVVQRLQPEPSRPKPVAGPVWDTVHLPGTVGRPSALKREVVISRYAEDLLWVDLGIKDHITIYNKGALDYMRPLAPHTLVCLENRGREAGTWLHHIVKNWDSLADITIFLQADAPVHEPDILRRLQVRWADGCGCLSRRYLVHAPEQWIKDQDLVEWADTDHGQFEVRYGNALIAVQPGERPCIDDLPAVDAARPLVSGPAWFNPAAWDFLFSTPMPDPLWFCYSGQWSISRRRIRCRSLRFYRHLLDSLTEEGTDGGTNTWTDPPTNPWTLEALWRYIWDPAYKTRIP